MSIKDDGLWWRFRCMDMWEWDAFNTQPGYRDSYVFTVLLPLAFGAVGVLGAFVELGMLMGVLALLGWVAFPIAVHEAGKINPIHVLAKAKRRERYVYGTHTYHAAIYGSAVNYCNLTKDERKEYPRGILEIAQHPDLQPSQRKQLSDEMNGLYNKIIERRKAKAVLSSRNLHIDHVLESIKDRRAGIESDTKTYKEFA